jgi:hypothetical protein
MPLLPPPPLLLSPTAPPSLSPPTRPDTRPAEARVQLLLCKTGLLRQQLRDLWGETSPQQATLVQKCLGLETEVTGLLQLIRDQLRTVATLGAEQSDAA